MTKKQAEKKIEEAKKLLRQVKESSKARASAVEEGRTPVGSDLSVLIDKLIAWLMSLIGMIGPNANGDIVHMLIHFARETVIPALKEVVPMWGDLLLMVIDAALAKLDEQYHPTT